MSRDFWNFDDLITVRIIPVLFKIAVVFNFIGGILWGIIAGAGVYQADIAWTFFKSVNEGFRVFLGVVIGLFVFAIASFVLTLLVRLSFEVIIVVFKIWENTKASSSAR